MDDCDIASRNEGFLNEVMIRNARARQEQEAQWDRLSARVCVDCDEPIAQERRRVLPGCVRCAACATLHERSAR